MLHALILYLMNFFDAAAISITCIFGYFRKLVCPSLLLVRFRFYEHGRLCLVDVSVPRCKFSPFILCV